MICAHAYLYTLMNIWIFKHTWIKIRKFICMCICIHIYVNICANTEICIYTYICIHTYTYIYIDKYFIYTHIYM